MSKMKIQIPAGKGFITCSSLGGFYHCGYGTEYDIYCKYKGIVREQKLSEEAIKSMEFGSWFEDSVAQFFCHKYNLKVKKMADGQMAFFKADMPYFICHPDRLGIGRDHKGRRFAVEVKCVRLTSDGWGEDGSSEIPDNYYLQVQGYFACDVPCDVVYVVCMRGNRIYVYEILPDKDVINHIRQTVREKKEAWDRGIIPSSENYDESVFMLSRKVKADAEGKPAGDEGLSIWSEMLENHKILKEAEDKEKALKKRMVDFMGDAPAVITADEDGKIKNIAKYVESHRSEFDKDAFKAALPDIYASYVTEKTVRQVNFAWPKEKKEEN